MLYKITEKLSVKELLICLKGYILGCLGIELDSLNVPSIQDQIDMFDDLMTNGIIDRSNSIRVILHSFEKIPQSHRHAVDNKDIKTYQEYVAYFAEEVINDCNYF